MKKISILFLAFALLGAGCGRTATPVVEEVALVEEQAKIVVGESDKIDTTVGVSLPNGEYVIDTSVSKVGWSAEKVTKQGHFGEIAISEGSLLIEDEKVVSGYVTMDINSIKSLDLPEGKSAGLIKDLKSEDFFFVDQHPTAKFVFVSIASSVDGKWYLTGDLTMRETTLSVMFPIEVVSAKDSLHLTGATTIDRTNWGVNARSGKFFANLGDNVVKDEVALTFDATWIK